jgi:hypothetical protein
MPRTLASLLATITRPSTFRRVSTGMQCLAVAVALCAPLATTITASAQMSRSLPTPVSAGEFAQMLNGAGIPKDVVDIALPLHETYFAQFRAFEEREVEPTLERAGDPFANFTTTVAQATETRDTRRRMFQRAAQLDEQLLTDVAALLSTDDASRIDRLRTLLSRRRAIARIPAGFGTGGAHSFDFTATPTVASLDNNSRAKVAQTLANYDAELTRLVERVAEEALELPVKSAELRAARGLSSTPQTDQALAAADAAEDKKAREKKLQQITEAWFREAQAVQQEARADLTQAERRVRKLHRDTLAQLDSVLPPDTARALRAELLRAVYPNVLSEKMFEATVAEITAMRAKGSLDDAQWAAVTAVIEAHGSAARPLVEKLMDFADENADRSFTTMFFVDANGETNADRPDKALRDELTALTARDTTALREAAGLRVVEQQVAVRGGRQIDGLPNIIGEAIGGAGDGMEVAIGATAVMMGSDGEMITLSGDDMEDAGMIFGGGDFGGGFGGGVGGGPRVVRPMGRDELDRLATLSQLDGAQRATFDEIAARAAEARKALEESEASDAPEAMTSEDGSFTITLSLAEDGGAVPTPTDRTKLMDGIDALEETMFDELRAAAASDRADAIERARRMRARARYTFGETGTHAVDLVAIADQAEMSDAARATAEAQLTEWDTAATTSMRAMRDELRNLAKRRDALFQELTQSFTSSTEDSTSTNTAIEINEGAAKELAEVERASRDARTKIADTNRRVVDAVVAALNAESSAAQAVRRAFLRAANPAIYKLPRDLTPMFTIAASQVTSDTGRQAIDRVRAAYIEEREARCEAYVNERDAEAKAGVALDPLSDPTSAVKRMQADMRERRRLREDLEQIAATAFRALKEVVEREAGESGAKALGELPSKAKRTAPVIRFGN